MSATQANIERHRAHIDRRISELENKLKEPVQQIQEQYVKDVNSEQQNLPYRRAFAQKENYIQPRQVTALRQRQQSGVKNVKQSRRKYQASQSPPSFPKNKPHTTIMPFQPLQRSPEQISYQAKPHNSHISPHAYPQSQSYQQPQQYIHNPRKQKQPITTHVPIPTKQPKHDLEVYKLMTQILNNQKSLQHQIHMLRNQWKKQKQIIRGDETSGNKETKSPNKVKENSVKNIKASYFKESQDENKPKMYEIINKKQQNPSIVSRQMSNIVNKDNTKRTANKSKKRKHPQNPQQFTLVDHIQPNEQKQKPRNFSFTHKPGSTSTKIPNSTETHNRLSNLIKNQKLRSERLIIPQPLKRQFWKQVQDRILTAQHQYKEISHKNNRHEHDYLVNTNQLQRKVREEIIGKIYAQVSNCVYK